MASLTPGILLKLLQSMTSPSKPTAPHRSALLQVTGILPSLSDPDSLFPVSDNHHRFLVQLSDSLNSTYVILDSSDSELLILSNQLRLGQFIHLDRFLLDYNADDGCRGGSSLPIAINLRPLPGLHPFVGSPEPLIVRIDPNNRRDFVIQPADPDDEVVPVVSCRDLDGEKREVLAPMISNLNLVDENCDKNPNPNSNSKANSKGKIKESTRFASPGAGKQRSASAGRRTSVGSGGAAERDPFPATGRMRRSASPVPSKCMVPSLAAAAAVGRDEGKRIGAREGAIVVPSRYRQPSPTATRRQGSPCARRLSVSPARRLSSGVRVSVSPGVGTGDVVGSKKKIAATGIGGSRVSEGGLGRKSWEERDGSGGGDGGHVKEKVGGRRSSRPDLQSILRTQAALSRRLSDANSRGSNDDSSVDGSTASNSAAHSPVAPKQSHFAAGIMVHEKKWTDGSVSLDALPGILGKLGKDALQRRAVAAAVAAEALEEAVATESVLRSMSMFSELCSTSKARSPLPTIEGFLVIYENFSRSAPVVGLVASNQSSENPAVVTDQSKYSSAWVEAALATDLGVVSLLTNLNMESPPLPQKGMSKRQSLIGNPKMQFKYSPQSLGGSTKQWKRGHGMKETVELATILSLEMEKWFLKFVEESLDAGFRVFGISNDGSGRSSMECGSVAAILSQLKRINEWLDAVVKKRDQLMIEKVERLKRKIYAFVIQHVGTTVDSFSPVASS